MTASGPTSVPTPSVIPSGGTQDVSYNSRTHPQSHNDLWAEVAALWTKLGTGSSTASASNLLRGTGAGATAFGQIQAGDITQGTVTLLKIAEVTVVGSAAATIDFTNIPQNYRHLMLMVSSRNNTAASLINCRLSSDGTTFDAGSNYDSQYVSFSAASSSASESLGATAGIVGAHSTLASTMNPTRIVFEDYTNASYAKSGLSDSGYKSGTGTGNIFRYALAFWWRSANAIQGIRLLPNANSFDIGSRATLYGLPA